MPGMSFMPFGIPLVLFGMRSMLHFHPGMLFYFTYMIHMVVAVPVMTFVCVLCMLFV